MIMLDALSSDFQCYFIVVAYVLCIEDVFSHDLNNNKFRAPFWSKEGLIPPTNVAILKARNEKWGLMLYCWKRHSVCCS